MKNVLPGLFVLLLAVHLAGPALAAAWAVPGAACTQEGANANSNGFLTCTGGVWVSNAVLMGTTAAACDAGKAGYIRYNGGSFEGCNGSAWVQLAGGSSAPTYLGVTASSYSGNLGGLSGANAKCVADFGPGARLMNVEDIYHLGQTTSYPVAAWIGHYGLTSSVHSCSLWSDGTNTYNGYTMEVNSIYILRLCNLSYPIHCVKN